MSRFAEARRVAARVGLAFVVLVLLAALNVGRLASCAMTPRVAFDAEIPPPAPDYGSSAEWSALPDRDDLADRAPTGADAVDQLRAPVDVFYVHPTSYVRNRWNAPTEDAELNEATDRVATGIQASAFNGCCAVYAPRYRQANGTAFTRASTDGDRAIALATSDVRRAFDVFNSRRGVGRPFILAAHSQGSVIAEQLLYDVIAGTPLRDQLVAAYLIGGGITAAGLQERAPDIQVCGAADDLHCVVAWNARGPAFVPTDYEMRLRDARERICVNPLSWRTDGAPASRELNAGAVFLETDDHAPRPAFADAQCANGTLVVSQIGAAPRDLPSRILDHVMGSGNYHPIEYQIFFMNLRQNASARAAAAVSAVAKAPQEPPIDNTPAPSPPPASPRCAPEPPVVIAAAESPSAADLFRVAQERPAALGSASIGSPTRGSLFGGVELKSSEDIVHEGGYGWGTALVVRSIERAAREVRRCFPDTPRLYVGDIARERGGWLRPHRSHQSGLDADIGYYYRTPATWYERATAHNLDVPRTWALVRALIEGGGVEMIFMDLSVQRLLKAHIEALPEAERPADDLFERPTKKDTIIRHTWGHATHFHVRFQDPAAVALGRRLADILPRIRAGKRARPR